MATLHGSPVGPNPAVPEWLEKTFGRFSVRGPAAWRLNGGTEKNDNTNFLGCKGLP